MACCRSKLIESNHCSCVNTLSIFVFTNSVPIPSSSRLIPCSWESQSATGKETSLKAVWFPCRQIESSQPLANVPSNSPHFKRNKAGYTVTRCGRVGRGGNARFPTFHYGPTDRWTDGLTDKASYKSCVSSTKKLTIPNNTKQWCTGFNSTTARIVWLPKSYFCDISTFLANSTPILRQFSANSAPYLCHNCLSPTCIQLRITHFLPLSGFFSFSQVSREMHNKLEIGAEHATSGLDSDRFPGPRLMLLILERWYRYLTWKKKLRTTLLRDRQLGKQQEDWR